MLYPKLVHLEIVGEYKVGDQPPAGYIAWFDWAKVQEKGGLRQKRCACGLWRYPQEKCCKEPK